jgi:hypothetical protein
MKSATCISTSYPRDQIAKWLTLFPLQHADPVILGYHPDRVGAELAEVKSATGVLISLRDRIILVTDWHVVDAYRSYRKQNHSAQLQFAETAINLDSRIIDEDQDLDLVTLDMTNATIKRAVPWSAGMPATLTPFLPSVWPPADLLQGDVVFFGGYVGAHRREELGGRILIHQPYSVSSLCVTGVFTGQFSIRIDRSGWQSVDGRQNHPGIELKDWGGLSGSPIFRVREVGAIIEPDLVGFVKEHKPEYEVLIGSYAHSIRGDGTIWH